MKPASDHDDHEKVWLIDPAPPPTSSRSPEREAYAAKVALLEAQRAEAAERLVLERVSPWVKRVHAGGIAVSLALTLVFAETALRGDAIEPSGLMWILMVALAGLSGVASFTLSRAVVLGIVVAKIAAAVAVLRYDPTGSGLGSAAGYGLDIGYVPPPTHEWFAFVLLGTVALDVFWIFVLSWARVRYEDGGLESVQKLDGTVTMRGPLAVVVQILADIGALIIGILTLGDRR